MKIITVEYNYPSNNSTLSSYTEPVVYMKADTGLLTDDKKRFFIPDFTQDVRSSLHLVVRINRMGKNIAERFAHRYYDQITVGIDFTAKDVLDKCEDENLPWEIGKSFDNSSIIGDLIKIEDLKNLNTLSFSLIKNEKELYVANGSNMIYTADKIIAYVSQFFTLKTGDLIFTGSPYLGEKIEIGDCFVAKLENDKLLELEIC